MSDKPPLPTARSEPHRNRLANEHSPYLLQHASNPVDWYPWGEEAFDRARLEDRPIFLSIGYATCHWCHVMEHESFEDPEVAALMNETFVNIKVDREERPDVDQVYMTVCQMLTGGGGWPLTIIMTPDKKPFFAATYIPRTSLPGRMGMLELIPRIHELWQTDRSRVLESAQQILGHLEDATGRASGGSLDPAAIDRAYHELAARYDAAHGGFGTRPKFPSPHNLLFLIDYWRRSHDQHALEMAETTLGAMRRGGIYDQLGFGFHRYSTDPEWLVPHFEKMLYDQAMLTLAYSEAYLATGDPLFRTTGREVLDYVSRDLTAPDGGFYCAEDADSEGEEGKFYLWTMDQVRSVLGADDARFAAVAYGLQLEGNYLDEASGRHTGANILHLPKPVAALADETGLDPGAFSRRLDGVRRRLFEAREHRQHPLKDDKILTDWNGLMAAAMARAGTAFGDPGPVLAAERAVAFVLGKLRNPQGRLLHRFRSGDASVPAFLDDYAFLTWACLELYEATLEVDYLERAVDLQEETLTRFWDTDGGGFYFTADDGEPLLVRHKEVYDGAVPSGNSVAMANLLRLSRLTGRPELADRAAALANGVASEVAGMPSAHTALLSALLLAASPSVEVVIAGDPTADDTRRLLETVRSHSHQRQVSLLLVPEGEAAGRIHAVAPFTEGYTSLDGRAAAYVCRDFTCQLPTTDPEAVLQMLGDATSKP